MSKVNLIIDEKTIQTEVGTSVLRAALDNDIYIPNLCHLSGDTEPAASCRLCFVEIEGKKAPVTACTEIVREGMVVNWPPAVSPC
jgi:bidirectional [NiFe] hydrogenase diaphorase subunit